MKISEKNVFRPHRGRGHKFLLFEAERGRDYAQLILAGQYVTGYGVPENLQEAAKWYGKAANSYRPYVRLEARFLLGFLALDANKPNYALDREAIRYLKQVAESDHPRSTTAKITLGKAYCEGERIPKDTKLGLRYFLGLS